MTQTSATQRGSEQADGAAAVVDVLPQVSASIDLLWLWT